MTGVTSSPDFPVTPDAYQTTFATFSNRDAGFVTKFNPSGTALVYSTFLLKPHSGSEIEHEEGHAIALDGSNNAYIAVHTEYSPPPDCVQTCDSVLALNSTGSTLNFAAEINLAGQNTQGVVQSTSVTSIAVDSSGNSNAVGAYIAMASNKPAIQRGSFLVRLDPVGNVSRNNLFQSLPYPGPMTIQPQAVALGPQGDIFIAGSAIGPFALNTPGAFQPNYAGGVLDAFLMMLDPSGSSIRYMTFLGGSSIDSAVAIAVDPFNNPYVTGNTGSSNFPATAGVFQPAFGGGSGQQPSDAFVARIAVPTATATPSPSFTPPTPTATATAPPTVTATPTGTPTRTLLPTRVPSPTGSASMTPSAIATITATATRTATPTLTATPALTPTPTATPTPIGPLGLAPAGLNFGRVKAGQTSPVRFVNVTNPKKNQGTAMITDVEMRSQMIGFASGFVIDAARSTCAAGTSLARGKSCRVGVKFSPPRAGAYADNLMITGNVTNSGQPIGLSGSAK